jgi:hypothetical protein
MAPPVSSLSQFCRSIAKIVADRLGVSSTNTQVRIGSPASAAPGPGDTDHRVNLFFYRVEPGAFGPAPSPDEPWLLRLSCLVTAFGVEEDSVSAGENDLRLLGAVLSVFHEKPVLELDPIDDTIVRAQVVFQPLGMEEINHLWATQGEVAYRPSAAYEMALVPIVPKERKIGGPLVGALGLEVRADEAGRRAPFSGVAKPPAIVAVEVRTELEGWAPRICFVVGTTCIESVSFAANSVEAGNFTPNVWVAGDAGAPVRLRWEIWDAAHGWRPGGVNVDTTATGTRFDPEQAASATTTAVALPFTDHAGQSVLYAERSFNRAADGVPITVRSNPLLVNLF